MGLSLFGQRWVVMIRIEIGIGANTTFYLQTAYFIICYNSFAPNPEPFLAQMKCHACRNGNNANTTLYLQATYFIIVYDSFAPNPKPFVAQTKSHAWKSRRYFFHTGLRLSLP